MFSLERTFWIESHGEKLPVVVRVGEPFEARGCWRCPMEIEGGEGRLADSRGESSMQAVALAIQVLFRIMLAHLHAGSHIFLSAESADRCTEGTIRSIFGQIANDK